MRTPRLLISFEYISHKSTIMQKKLHFYGLVLGLYFESSLAETTTVGYSDPYKLHRAWHLIFHQIWSTFITGHIICTEKGFIKNSMVRKCKQRALVNSPFRWQKINDAASVRCSVHRTSTRRRVSLLQIS